MSYGLPDDWDSFYRTCKRGHRYHASEHYCDRCVQIEENDKPLFVIKPKPSKNNTRAELRS